MHLFHLISRCNHYLFCYLLSCIFAANPPYEYERTSHIIDSAPSRPDTVKNRYGSSRLNAHHFTDAVLSACRSYAAVNPLLSERSAATKIHQQWGRWC